VGNFQETYVRLGNSWDLRACTQKPDESLRDFIRRFSKRCTELPSVALSEIMHAFLKGMTCRDLVRKLGRSPPVESNELFDIATSFTPGEEAVGAIFDGRRASAWTTSPRRPAEAQAGQERQEAAPRGARAGVRRRRERGPRC
jgi:hypothetical protein